MKNADSRRSTKKDEDSVHMKNPLTRLQEMREYVGHSEQLVAEKLLENPQIVLDSNIRDLAAHLYVSSSTIVRLCKHLGFNGYRDFRQAIIYEMALYEGSKKVSADDVEKNDNIEDIVKKITHKNITSLEETRNMLDIDSLKKCTDLLCSCRNVLLFGLGASLCVARDACLKFLRMNKPCFVNDDWHAQLLYAQNAGPEDLGIIISYSGETEEMVKCLQQLEENHTPSIAITRFAPSTIASMATHVLYTYAGESLFRSGATSSRIAQLNVIDILYTAYATYNYEECMIQMNETHIAKPNTEIIHDSIS